MRKFRSLFAVILAIGLMMALVACGGNTNAGWTVKVLDIDGNPYTAVMVQPCIIGEGGACYGPFALDENASITLETGKHITDESAEELEIHLARLPVYLTFDHTVIKKGETKTIQARFKGESDLSVKGGSGTEDAPYTIKSGTENNSSTGLPEQIVYGLKFNDAEQKIIFAVTVDANESYTVNTYGVDAKIVKLNAVEAGFEATETTGNGTLSIETGDGETVVYLEVSLNGEGVGTDAYIWVA